MRRLRLIVPLILATFTLAFFSTCQKDDDPAVEWTTGTVTTMNISASAGEEVFEPVNGLTFSFPDGGSGSLEVAPILSGADPVFEECTGFLINYDGQTEIRFVVEDTSETAMLWGWGSNDGLMEDYTDADDMWVSIPFETLEENKRSYMLVMPETSYIKNAKAVHAGFKYYIWLPHLSLYHQDKLAWLIEKKNLMHANYIGSLPPTIKENTLARVNSNYSRIFFSSAAYYDPWWNVLGKISLKTIINLAANVNDSTVHLGSLAHEDGHYMLHMMLGDEIFGTIVSQLPNPVPDDHGVGDLRNRTDYYIEESAYFSEYFHTGIVSNTSSPEDLRTFLWSNTNMPDKVDYPSLEGFGVAMLANLHRTDARALSIYMPEKYNVFVELPVIGASFEDIFGIIARGSKNIDELRQHISDYLDSQNKGDMLAPFLQRLGWGYQVKVKAVDADNKPLSGITARSVCRAGGKYWYGTTSYFASGADGILTIPEVFGGEDPLYEGTRFLRFYFENDSLDVDNLGIDLDISWLNKTNEIIDLGSVTLDFSNTMPPYLESKDYGLYVGMLNSWLCPDSASAGDYIYFPRYHNMSGDYITCTSNGGGSVSISWTNNSETCTGSGTVMPHHIEMDGWMPVNYYSFNISFEYNYQGVPSYKYTGSITGIGHLDTYFTSRQLDCNGTMTLYWKDGNGDPQECSYQKSFTNQSDLHDFGK